MKLRRVILLMVLAVDVLILVLFWPAIRGPGRHVDDRVGLIPWADELRFNRFLDGVRNESGIDVRVVIVPDARGSTPDQLALNTMRGLGIGRETGGRGLLILYDTLDRAMRIEVGPKLEGILPDAFVGYLMRNHLDAFFSSGKPEFGLRTTLFMIHWRIRKARLGEEYDPSFEEYLRDVRRVAAGGGASGRLASGSASARLINRTGDTAAVAYFRPQPTVEDAYRLQQEWLARGGGQVDVPLFTRGEHAVLPQVPPDVAGIRRVSPRRRVRAPLRGGPARRSRDALLHRRPVRVAQVLPAHAGGVADGRRGRGGELAGDGRDVVHLAAARERGRLQPSVRGPVHADAHAGHGRFLPGRGGDNRALVIQGNAKKVESELDPNERHAAESITDGVPGVEYLTVRKAAERIRAARGRPAVVILYGIWNEETQGQLPEIVRVARACRERGVEFFAFHTDHLPRAVEALPDTLRRYGAPFPVVQLYRWKSGMLAATMDDLGISVGMSWMPPLAAVLDREGEVVWQAQGVSDWAAVEKAALAVADGGTGTE